MVAIYQRCLANYQSKQWDLGAYALYNATLLKTLQYSPSYVPCIQLQSYGDCLGACLLYSVAQGSGVSPCLGYWLQDLNVKDSDYFQYSNASGATESSDIDACQVHQLAW